MQFLERSMTVLFSLGLNSQFADWCDAVVVRLAERALGETTLIAANTPEEIASAIISTDAQHIVVSSRQPSHWLRQVLASSERRFILALDDPRVALVDVMESQQLNWVGATRLVACGCASMTQCLAFTGALVLEGHRGLDNPYTTATAMARHLGLAVAPGEIEAIVADLTACGAVSRVQASSNRSNDLSEPSIAMADGALSAYRELFLGEPLSQIIWARDLFLTENGQPATQAIELTGRRRFLIYGPYIRVPAGHWTAEVVLGFSQEAAEINFTIDACAGAPLAVASIRPPKEGIFPVTLNFEVTEANDNLLEIRVVNDRAAFDGKMALMIVTLSLQQKIPRAVIEDWARKFGLLGHPSV
jgi:hypothetical protein